LENTAAYVVEDNSAYRGAQKMLLQEIVIADSPAPLEAAHSKDQMVAKYGSSHEEKPCGRAQQDRGTEGTSKEEDDDSDSEEEVIPGCLEFSPPVGTQVKVLYDDDRWYRARVVASNGTKTIISFGDDKRACLDLDEHAVRLASYVDEDEDEENDDDDESESDDESHQQSQTVKPQEGAAFHANVQKENEKKEHEQQKEDEEKDDDEEEEAIPGTLDDAPPVGTAVKVLYDDDEWYFARVTATNGTIATVVYDDGAQEDLDCDEHAVRLADYVEEKEKSDVKGIESAARKDTEQMERMATPDKKHNGLPSADVIGKPMDGQD